MPALITACRACGYQELFSATPADPPTKEDQRLATMLQSKACVTCGAAIEFNRV
ncbi:MAG TPA: hypothetical protein VJB16_03755 [archaeon]|nr:hypothetical protein [archaeon]